MSERIDDIFGSAEDWPGATAFVKGGDAALYFTKFLISAGFSDVEAADISLSAVQIEDSDKADRFVQDKAKANVSPGESPPPLYPHLRVT